MMPPRVVTALANLPHREGPVFLTPKRSGGQPYTDRQRRTGGKIKTAWGGAIARAGLDPEFTPHDLRHTWASWHYALHKDLIRLQLDSGWSGVLLVTRYAHLMPARTGGRHSSISRDHHEHNSNIGNHFVTKLGVDSRLVLPFASLQAFSNYTLRH